jgi:UDPglucose 6-dehydrogenase
MKHTIGVVGLWHLGCVLCASWSKLGNKVIGFDYDASRIDALSKADPPLYEPNLSEVIQSGLQQGFLHFSNSADSLSECDFVFLSYDTPVNEDDSSDTTILEQAVGDLANVMKNDSVLVVSSQSPVGFCRQLRSRLREKNKSLELAYSPENLRLGEAIQCYLNPGRIILGTESPAAERKCRELFSQIEAEMLSMNLESAEMVKHGINSFLATSIVFANHLADICESAGARIDDVVRGMKTDPRIGAKAYLSCGIGFSGGTLGRDLQVLSRKNSERKGYAKIFNVIHELNSERKSSIVERIAGILGGIAERSVGILGLTYKPGTSTLRRSLPLEIVNLLIDRKANVKVYDPKADYGELGAELRFKVASSIKDAAEGADILILLTEWPDFKEYNWQHIPQLMRQPFLLDTKNVLKEDQMITNGFKYFSVGR